MTVVAPESAPATTDAPVPWYRRPAARVAGFAVAVVVLSLLQAYRQAGVRSWNTVWAEDGDVYLAQGNHLDALFHTYSGYLQLVPRLAGLGANLIPLDQVARYLTATSAVVTSLCAIGIFLISRPLVPSPWLRGVLAVSTFLVPGVLGENLNAPTNLIWVLLFACWWALVVAPSTQWRAIGSAAIALVAVLSSVLALLYLPMAALLAWKRPGLRSRAVLATFAAGAVVQGLFVLTADDPEGKHTTHAGDLVSIYGVRVLGSGLFGDSLVKTAWLDHGELVAIVGALVVIPVVVWLVLQNRGMHRCLGAVTVAYSVAMFVFAVARRGSTGFEVIEHRWNSNGGRFVALSLWLLLSGLAILISGARVSATAKRIMVVLFVAQFAVVGVGNYRASNGRSPGPAWNVQVAGVTTWCERQRPQTLTAIPITPRGWFAVLRCDRVLR